MAFLPVFFIWLGVHLPEAYQQKFKECETSYGSCKLIGQTEQKQLVHKYGVYHENNTIIQRADVLRLLVIQQYGGIYLDFDVEIQDWNFLKLLDCDRDTYFPSQQIALLYQRTYRAGNWMLCSGKNTTQLTKLIQGLKQIHKNPSPQEVLDYAGPGYIDRMKSKYIVVYPNIKHCYHNNWTTRRPGCVAPLYSYARYLGSACFLTMGASWVLLLTILFLIGWKKKFFTFMNQDQNVRILSDRDEREPLQT